MYTSPALEYLSIIIKPSWRVFEYGSGGSTRYYKEHCALVKSIEHSSSYANDPDVIVLTEKDAAVLPGAHAADAAFFSSGFDLPEHPTNATETEYHGMDNHSFRGYASQIFDHATGYFDVIVVDGMARSLCLYYAAMMCNPDGYIILDNSCRWQYNDVQEHIINQGWHRRDFWEPAHPGYCTSFFSRSYTESDLPIRRPNTVGDLYHAIGW